METSFFEALGQIQRKDWMLLSIGTLLGFLLPFLVYLVRLIYLHVQQRGKLKPYCGEWHVYHWSREDYTPVFIHSKWRVKSSLFTQLRLVTKDADRKQLFYSGTISFESGHVIITMEASGHREETLHVRAQPEPIPGDSERGIVLRGISLNQDFDRESYAAVYLVAERKVAFLHGPAIHVASTGAIWYSNWAEIRYGSRVNESGSH